jgi:hypothetical protein
MRHFTNKIKTVWLANGRDMMLLEDVSYIDSNGKEWLCEQGSIINGASIPTFLWTLVGSPYVGLYRDASVPHDVYCALRTEPWQDVHAMFYDAMLCCKVPQATAQLMYKAVYNHGPRWDENGEIIKPQEDTINLYPFDLSGHLE